ncbi:MAG: 3-oxoacyl-[acyl-carrier-protein] synthase III C-terminal domain-containing protein [Cyanobacteria bacterium J06639_18]
MNNSVGIRSLAICFPEIIRTQDDWIEQFPELSNKFNRRKARRSEVTISSYDNSELDIWSQEVIPYLSDPFRGNVENRVLDADQSSLTLEYQAGKEALEAAQLAPEEVELLIVASFDPGRIGHGNACYLAEKLGLRCPAWNLESTCSGALIALQNANALLQTGTYGNVLVVVSHVGSKNVDRKDTLSLSMGDGAGAFVVDTLKPNQGILGTKTVNTTATLDAYTYEQVVNSQGKPQILTRTGENASALAETAVDLVRICCEGALAAAELTLKEINFFAFNTPTAWYARVCSRALDIDPERTINLYPCYGNIGPIFPIANLYHAAQSGKIRENDLVLVYTNGASATATATVMHWGDVVLGSPPTPAKGICEDKRLGISPIFFNKQDKESSNPIYSRNGISRKDAEIQGVQQISPVEEVEEIEKVEKIAEPLVITISKEKLLAAKPEERQQLLETTLIQWLAASMQIDPVEINPQELLTSYLDSLMALTFKSRVETDLAVRVPIEDFFGENNIVKLAKLLLEYLLLVDLISSVSAKSEAKYEFEEREKLSF